jgi:hypothetical protein
MRLTPEKLSRAVARGILTDTQASALWVFLNAGADERASFKPAHILYYLGGLIAIGAMTLFMTLGWEKFGGAGLCAIALVYGVVAVAITETLVRREGLRTAAGLTAALVVATVPLAIYGAQHALGAWPAVNLGDPQAYRDYHTRIDWRWYPMEIGTLIAGLLVIARYRLPFSVMPVAATLWYMSMDLAPLLFGGGDPQVYWEHCKWVSIGFGGLTVLLGVIVDLRTRDDRDFGFWLYLFGVLAFWGGLTSLEAHSEWGRFGYCLINLGLIAVGAILVRRVFAVFGGLGVAGYLGHLSYTVFRDSLLFPMALTAVGLLVIVAGIAWQRREVAIGLALRRVLPEGLRSLVERRASTRA